MSTLHCQCTENMLASCDTVDSDWGTLLVCVGVIFLILGGIVDRLHFFLTNEDGDPIDLLGDRYSAVVVVNDSN